MRSADAREHLEERIVRDPAIMGGEAVVRGTRVPLRLAGSDDSRVFAPPAGIRRMPV